MAKNKSTLEVIPSARRLIHSLRDVGYDFVHAVADLVDNSIAAKASNIAIEMRFEEDAGDSWFRIADNGTGMSGNTITEAMRFGTERDYDSDELGKFGLGLKTASLSQCSRFTVASRIDRDSRRIEVRQWDLDHVDKTNRWEIINIPPNKRSDTLMSPLQHTPGTVVLWELLDRMMGYKNPWGHLAKMGFFRLAEDLDQHLGMTFHRFLSGEAKRKKKLKITINGTNVDVWDPFAREEKATVCLPGRQFEIAGDNGRGLVAYTPYILPRQNMFSSLSAFNRYSGPAKWSRQQGFYIYRADRMIQSGGWSRTRTLDEHTKYARVALDFMPDLDSTFDVNVSKVRVNLPANLKAMLEPPLEQLVKLAKEAYNPKSETGASWYSNPGGVRPKNNDGGDPPSGDSEEKMGAQDSDDALPGVKEPAGAADPTSRLIGEVIEAVASRVGEAKALKKIKRALRNENPALADEIGW